MQLNTIIRLRRDNQNNYDKVKDTFIPANGELCLVDTLRDGLRVVCGNGISTFGELRYLDDFIIKGYYSNNKFYQDKNLSVELPAQINKIYICITNTYTLYIYDGMDYHKISGSGTAPLPNATAEVSGIMKLYDTIGNNTDGTMTQKAITDELNEKIEIELNKDEELLIFTY